MAESASASPSVSPSASPSSSPSASPSKSPSKSPSASPSVSPSPIPAGEVSYTMRSRYRIGKLRLNFVAITFGGSSEYYPNGGIPLTNANLGLTNNPKAVIVLEDNFRGYSYQWDRSANTIRMGVSATGTVDSELDDNNITATTLELLVIGP